MKTLFISDTRFPNGNSADVVRFSNIIKIFKANGDNVEVISLGLSTKFSRRIWNGIQYVSLRSEKQSFIIKIIDRLLFQKRAKAILNLRNDINRIVVYNIPNALFRYLKKYSIEHRITLIFDCVEWYSKEEFSLGCLDPRYIKKDRLVSHIVDKNVSVISISNFLYEYFNSKGINTIRVPAIFEVSKPFSPKRTNDKVIFMYAGSPGRKDLLKEIISAFDIVPNEYSNRYEFRIYGIDWKWLCKQYKYSKDDMRRLSKHVKVYGRVSQEKIREAYVDANYSVLLRPNDARYAKAGFPTKVAESMICGVPVITNLSSDLAYYIVDGESGWVVEGEDRFAFSKTVMRAIDNVSRIEYIANNAYDIACSSFNWKSYVNLMRFL